MYDAVAWIHCQLNDCAEGSWIRAVLVAALALSPLSASGTPVTSGCFSRPKPGGTRAVSVCALQSELFSQHSGDPFQCLKSSVCLCPSEHSTLAFYHPLVCCLFSALPSSTLI